MSSPRQQPTSPRNEVKKVFLIGIDSGDECLFAVEQLVNLMKKSDEALLLTVTENTSDPQIEKRMEEAKRYFEKAGLKTQQYVQHNSHVGQELVHQAKFLAADYLVVGAKNVNPLKKILLGSASEYCLHHAHCPVIIMRSPL